LVAKSAKISTKNFIICIISFILVLFQANKYLENYERALSGFEAAALKDPDLGADTEVQKITSLLDKLVNAMKVTSAYLSMRTAGF
jgi:hypothetical protein